MNSEDIVNVDGALLNEAMIKQIKDWQRCDNADLQNDQFELMRVLKFIGTQMPQMPEEDKKQAMYHFEVLSLIVDFLEVFKIPNQPKREP
jgi:hypothetical protein